MENRKRGIALAALLLTVMSLSAQKKFEIKGDVVGAEGQYVRLSYGIGGNAFRQDSSKVENGKFGFKGEINGPTFSYFSFGTEARSREALFSAIIEPTKMKLKLNKDNMADSKLIGSRENDFLAALEARKQPINQQMEPLRAEYQKRSEEYAVASKALKEMEQKVEAMKEDNYAFREKFEPFQQQLGELDMDFIRNNPQSIVSAYLMRFKVSQMSLGEVETIYHTFTPDVQQSTFGQEVANEIKKMRSGSPGSPAYVFAKADINGEQLSLTDFRGKYVLLDFWASWCVPCRKGNPHLIELYNKYKALGFEIIGISDDDRDEKAWKKAVEQDQIQIWKHVLRGLKMNGQNFDRSQDISEHYGIHTLPTKILIDPQGVIVGRYASGAGTDEDLDKKLAEIFR